METINILITGDLCPVNRVEQLIYEHKTEEIYNDFMPFLQGNDLSITNLECPLIDFPKPIFKHGPNLRAGEKCISLLKDGNFNLVTLANNHIMDQGNEGLFSTMRLCDDSGIDYTGAGSNLEEASRTFIKKIKGMKIAVVNFCELEFSIAGISAPGAHPMDPVKNFYAIQSARKMADYVIVIVHGGHEGYPLPSPWMVDTYQFFIDVGASVVVGHHPHCYSGYEKYNGGMIFYSLGNFIFDVPSKKESDWNFGFALRLNLSDRGITFEKIPYKQCSSQPGILQLSDKEKKDFEQNFIKLNSLIDEPKSLLQKWEEFAASKRNEYTLRYECLDFGIYNAFRYRKYLPPFLSKKRKLKLLNLMRCQSHRELSIKTLQY